LSDFEVPATIGRHERQWERVRPGECCQWHEYSAYEYGPFGEVIRATGSTAKANPFRFSTKYQDDESDLFYYGHRYCNAITGRWLSKDPLRELGFELAIKHKSRFEKLYDNILEALNALRTFKPNWEAIARRKLLQGGFKLRSTGEAGNLYAFVNDPIQTIDSLGLQTIVYVPGPFFIPPPPPPPNGL
jgi:RHS repeat-associated protein